MNPCKKQEYEYYALQGLGEVTDYFLVSALSNWSRIIMLSGFFVNKTNKTLHASYKILAACFVLNYFVFLQLGCVLQLTFTFYFKCMLIWHAVC